MKGIVIFLVLLLGAWMAGAEYVWLCKVKNHCDGTPLSAQAPTLAERSATDSAGTTTGTEVSAPQPEPQPTPAANAPVGDALTASSTEPTRPVGAPSAAPRVAPQAAPTVIDLAGGASLTTRPLGFEPDAWQISDAAGGAEYVGELAEFLTSSPAIDVTVSGEYFVFESTPAISDNLGEARAAALKTALTDAGVAASRITVDSALLMDRSKKPGFTVAAEDFSDLVASRTVFFEPAAITASAGPELRGYAREVNRFLQRHRGASLRVTGHTDNTGEAGVNETLGLSRARHVAELLGTMGLPATRVRIGSRGQNEPVADNNTEAGRAANRRVEIQLDLGRR